MEKAKRTERTANAIAMALGAGAVGTFLWGAALVVDRLLNLFSL